MLLITVLAVAVVDDGDNDDVIKIFLSQVLKPHVGSASYSKAARQFLLKWSFYTSMVIRDLTLRSAASFGSFHLIRLLFDEFVFYLVERKVAASLGVSSVGVMETAMGGTATPRATEGSAGARGGSGAAAERNATALRSGRQETGDQVQESAVDGGGREEERAMDVAGGKRIKTTQLVTATTDDEFVTSTSSIDSSDTPAWDSVVTPTAVETILPS